MKITIASAVCVFYKNKLLLVRQGNDAKRSPGLWGPPAGRKRKNESFLEIAKRELKEEAGLKVVFDGFLECGVWKNNKRVAVVAIYKTVLDKKPKVQINDPEHMVDNFVWASKQDILKNRYPLRDEKLKEILIRSYKKPALPLKTMKLYFD